MKRWILLAVLAITLAGCKKANDHDSIFGIWQCDEDSEELGFRKYTVTVMNDPYDTTMYVFSNLHNLGNGEDSYVEFYLTGDSIIIPGQIVNSYSIDGKGVLEPDFSEINLKYTIQGATLINVEATLY